MNLFTYLWNLGSIKAIKDYFVEMEEGLNFIAGSQASERTGDIVFVHGLRGHYKKTWHPKESNLNPEQLEKDTAYFPYWLGEDIANVGIWSYRYKAEPSVWSAKIKPGDPDLKGITMSLFDRSKNLISVLKDREVGQRPLVFITHSLGGLIVKKMLRDLHDTRENLDNKTIIDQTQGVVFIATPHQGSHLATLLGWLGGFGQVTITGDELKENNPGLRDLNEWYRLNSETPRIGVKAMVFYETQPLPNFKDVVDPNSANPYLSTQVEVIPINADHISIAKPTSKEAIVYLSTRRFIKRCFPTPPLSPVKEITVCLVEETQNSEPVREFINHQNFENIQRLIDDQKAEKEINLQELINNIQEVIKNRGLNNIDLSKHEESFKSLENFLEAQNWRKADAKTKDIMFDVISCPSKNLATIENLKKLIYFPCNALLVINDLWEKYSERRFGFNVQKDKYLEITEKSKPKNINVHYRELKESLSWTINDEPTQYYQNNITTENIGYYPLKWLGGGDLDHDEYPYFMILMSILQYCECQLQNQEQNNLEDNAH